MILKETLGNLEVRLLGNRLFALGMPLLFGGFPASFMYLSNNDYRNFFLSIAATIVGAGLVGINADGRFTFKSYQRTKGHIEQFGEIKPEFFREYIKDTNGRICGYCDVQGIYLAARELNKLESFYKNRREQSKCIIPNF